MSTNYIYYKCNIWDISQIYKRGYKSFMMEEYFNRVIYLKFENNFKEPIPQLPGKLKYLIIDDKYFNRKLPMLPSTLKYLHLGEKYNKTFPPLKDTKLKELIICTMSSYNKELPELPKTLKNLSLNYEYNKRIPDLYNTKIKKIKIHSKYNQPYPRFPSNLRILQIIRDINPVDIYNYNNIVIPKKLKYLWFIGDISKYIPDLTYSNISYLRIEPFSRNMTKLPKLPQTLKKIVIYHKYDYVRYGIYVNVFPDVKYLYYIQRINDSPFAIKSDYYKSCNIFKYITYTRYKTTYFKEYVFCIKKNIRPFMIYILYNKNFIPYEIYNYIYNDFGFTYEEMYINKSKKFKDRH